MIDCSFLLGIRAYGTNPWFRDNYNVDSRVRVGEGMEDRMGDVICAVYVVAEDMERVR